MKRNLFYLLLLSVWLPNLLSAQWHYNILWEREGQNEDSHYGAVFGSLGDQNNDGYSDWAVKASGGGRAGEPNENYVEFFYGGQSLIQDPYMVYRADPLIHWDMSYFIPTGDLNEDGFIDWIIVFRPIENYQIHINQIYFGGPNADTIPDLVFRTSWNVFLYAIGDYNADGFDDLWGWDDILQISQIYYGGVVMNSIPDLNMPAMYRVYGDLNGDQSTDFFIGVYGFFYGGIQPDTTPAYIWTDLNISGDGIVNDLNGDGKDEFILIPNTLTSINVHFGRSDSLSRMPDYILNYPCGWRCFSLGDINDDGYNDMVAFQQNNESFGVFLGHPWLNLDPTFTMNRWDNPLNLASFATVIGLNDVNGDGVGDFAIGGSNQAFILSGDSTSRVPVSEPFIPQPLSFKVSVFPNPFNAEATVQLDLPTYTNEVSLSLFNILGQEVFKTELTNISLQTTYHLDASALASGVYFLKVQAGELSRTNKLMVQK